MYHLQYIIHLLRRVCKYHDGPNWACQKKGWMVHACPCVYKQFESLINIDASMIQREPMMTLSLNHFQDNFRKGTCCSQFMVVFAFCLEAWNTFLCIQLRCSHSSKEQVNNLLVIRDVFEYYLNIVIRTIHIQPVQRATCFHDIFEVLWQMCFQEFP